jgi:CRP-like cAMP-binding protein
MPNFHLEIEKILEELAINEIELKKDILKDIVLKKYLPTQQIISTSSQSKSVYMMVSGSAKALLYSEDGNEVWFSNFSKGQIFGEMAVLSNSGRSADICAISNVVAIKFSESKFLYLLNRYGNFSVFVMRQIIQRFRMTSINC